jgi:predicted metal-dependent peptidase
MSRANNTQAAVGDPFDLPLLIFHLRNVSPFFGALALFSESVVTEDIETAATDGRRLLFNPKFMSAHPVPEQLGILVHELLHAALRHVKRRATADPHLWNIAADIVVNGMIDESPGLRLPKTALLDEKLAHFPVEEVYEILLKRHGLPKKILFIGGDLLKPSDPSEGEGSGGALGGLDEHWNSAFAQAAVVARLNTHGNLPASLERLIGSVAAPPLDWRALLWRHITRTPVDFTAYDRRFLGEELYLDALDGESVSVAVCVDTSGSIGEKDLGRFLNEIRAILAAYPATKVDLYCCDTDLHGPWKLDSPECPTPKMTGGGGTSFVPFFGVLKNSPPDAAVYLTDGFGKFPGEKPTFPTLWVILPGGLLSQKFPFGETARMLGD